MSALQGSIVVVSGASRGIGLAIAETLRESGAIVVRLARSLGVGGGEGFTDVPCDVTDEQDVERAVGEILATVGPPDILVNNAGSFLLKSLAETTPADFSRQLEVNLTGAFLLLRAFLPHLIRKDRAHVVTIGSVADHVAYPGNAAYGASKHGLRGLHEVLAREVSGTDVRTTLISPGPTDTELWDHLDLADRSDLMNRADMLQAEDIAQAVQFAVTRPQRVNVELIRLSPSA